MAYHSITFVDGTVMADKDGKLQISGRKRNTWDDWHMVPTSRPTIPFAEVNTNYVEVPGSNGSLDLSEALTGYPTYKDREGSFEFILMNTNLNSSAGESIGYSGVTDGAFSKTLDYIANFLHGRKLKMLLEDYPGQMYVGRFTISDPKSNDAYVSLTINYHLEPLSLYVKYDKSLWLWDPLKFSAGVNKYTGVMEGDKGTHIAVYDGNEYGGTEVPIQIDNPGDLPVSVKMGVTVESILRTQNGTITLPIGDTENGLMLAYPGSNTWYIKAKDSSQTGKYTISYQTRSL